MGGSHITFTRHAIAMLAERDISREWVDLTLQTPDVIEPDQTRENVFRAFRAIPERQGRVLRVVYSKQDQDIRIITAFFDRARKR